MLLLVILFAIKLLAQINISMFSFLWQSGRIKETGKGAKLYRFDICLVWRILWIGESLFLSKNHDYDIWYSWVSAIAAPYKYHQHYFNERCLFSWEKNLWKGILEASKKPVTQKAFLQKYGLILSIISPEKTKKINKPVDIIYNILTRMTN